MAQSVQPGEDKASAQRALLTLSLEMGEVARLIPRDKDVASYADRLVSTAAQLRAIASGEEEQ